MVWYGTQNHKPPRKVPYGNNDRHTGKQKWYSGGWHRETPDSQLRKNDRRAHSPHYTISSSSYNPLGKYSAPRPQQEEMAEK